MASSDGDGENSSEDALEGLTQALSSDDEDEEDERGLRLVRTALPAVPPHRLGPPGGGGSGRFVFALSGFRGFSMSSGGRVGRPPRPRRLASVLAPARTYSRRATLLDGARSRSPVLTHLTAYRSCGHLARPIDLPAFSRWHSPLVISTSSDPPLASLGGEGFEDRAADEDDVMEEDGALADEDDDDENVRYRLTSSDESVDMIFEVEDDAETDETETAAGVTQDEEEGEEEDEEDGEEGGEVEGGDEEEEEQVDEVGEAAVSDEEAGDDEEDEEEEEENGDEDEGNDEEEEEADDEHEEEEESAAAQEAVLSLGDGMEVGEEMDEDEGGEEEREEEDDEGNEGGESAAVAPAVALPQAQPRAPSDTSAPPPAAPAPNDTSAMPVPPLPEPQPGLVGSLLEILECPVCYEPMRPPIWQCSRGHMVCKDCAPRLKRCPTCRCTARRSRNCTMEKVCAQLQYPCRFHPRGCGVTLPPAELDGHELVACAYRDSPCRVPRCSWRGVDTQLRAHARAAHAGLSKAGRAGAPVTMRVPVWGSNMRHCRLLDHATHVYFVHFLVDSGTLSGCVQLFGPAAQARDLEYRMELDERERPRRHQHHQHRDALQRVADIQERINYFQARLRHSVSSDFGGGGGGAGGQGILEASTWTWARVLGVDEDPEHALRGGRAWRVDLGRARRLTSHSRFAKTRVRVTVQPVTRHGE